MKRAVYAGSFDPFTNGHLYIYNSAAHLFDEVIILIAHNPIKSRYTKAQNMQYLITDLTGARVVFHEGLVADFCKKENIYHLIRGLRNTSDYLYEEEIAKVNIELFPELQTVYFRAKDDAISSSMVRLMVEHGKPIDKYVPANITRHLERR